jgi:hypothetical protein
MTTLYLRLNYFYMTAHTVVQWAKGTHEENKPWGFLVKCIAILRRANFWEIFIDSHLAEV